MLLQFDAYLSIAHGMRRRNRGNASASAEASAAHQLALATTGKLPPVKASLQPAILTTQWETEGLPPEAHSGLQSALGKPGSEQASPILLPTVVQV